MKTSQNRNRHQNNRREKKNDDTIGTRGKSISDSLPSCEGGVAVEYHQNGDGGSYDRHAVDWEGQNKNEEVSVIVSPYTVSYPSAMMVKVFDTVVTNGAMRRSRWFV